jgi:hypothetical protein
MNEETVVTLPPRANDPYHPRNRLVMQMRSKSRGRNPERYRRHRGAKGLSIPFSRWSA